VPSSSTQLLLLTQADLHGAPLFRVVSVDVAVRPGEGRLWVDLSRDTGYAPAWQQHLRHLAAVGRGRYALPWDESDFFFSVRGRKVLLDGRSASLPLFVAWVALLAGRELPAPFLATGVALDASDALVSAPLEKLQGKLAVADGYVRQIHAAAGRVPVWVPAGSQWDAAPLTALDVRPVASLTAAAESVLGALPLRQAAPAGTTVAAPAATTESGGVAAC
jgi:predicted S18 family serine protease